MIHLISMLLVLAMCLWIHTHLPSNDGFPKRFIIELTTFDTFAGNNWQNMNYIPLNCALPYLLTKDLPLVDLSDFNVENLQNLQSINLPLYCCHTVVSSMPLVYSKLLPITCSRYVIYLFSCQTDYVIKARLESIRNQYLRGDFFAIYNKHGHISCLHIYHRLGKICSFYLKLKYRKQKSDIPFFLKVKLCTSLSKPLYNTCIGGGMSIFNTKELIPLQTSTCQYKSNSDGEKVKFVQIKPKDEITSVSLHQNSILCEIPLSNPLVDKLSKDTLCILGAYHNISLGKLRKQIIEGIKEHDMCSTACVPVYFVFEPPIAKITKSKKSAPVHKESKHLIADLVPANSSSFPPLPPTKYKIADIVGSFCSATHPSNFEESGCAVCGQLTPLKNMVDLNTCKINFSLLERYNVTWKERLSSMDPIEHIQGPVLYTSCKHVCNRCLDYMRQYDKAPTMSLVNGLWLGVIPPVLQDLSFMEKMMIARVRHSYCFVKVAVSWRYEMKANVVCFSNPMPKVYKMLPPAKEELDSVIAFMYTGPCKPTPEDLRRTPLLVRLNKVRNALDWLKLNESESVPVGYDYEEMWSNKDPLTSSVHETEEDDGTLEGPCPFTVHGLAGVELNAMTSKEIKQAAIHHLKTGDKNILFVGHNEVPEQTFNSPSLYPQMFPHLFPYGFGGISNTLHVARTSSLKHKRWLLMYHDKRFQTDPIFALIAFNWSRSVRQIVGAI